MAVIRLNKKIKVLAKFIEGGIKPCKFAYEGKTYDIKSINGSYLSNNGYLPTYFFAVEAKQSADIFELAFSLENLKWHLKKIVSEDFL